MVTEADIRLADGRTLHAYDTRDARDTRAVFWLHGSPNVGSPPVPLFAAAEANGLGWVSYDRPGYGGSDPDDGRAVGSAAADVAAVADALAAVRPWGFRPDAIEVPVLIMHGAKDKMVPPAHGAWLAARCRPAESRVVPDAGHITVLDSAPEALGWLAALS